MSSTYTNNLGLRKPAYKDPATFDSWDVSINGNMDAVDNAFGNRNYTEQNYISNADSHTASIDKLDMGLKDVTDLAPTQAQHDALTGEGTPSGTNLYVTKSYVRMARKEVLFPEFQSATFALSGSGTNVGLLSTNSETNATNYTYNYYKWLNTTEPAFQDYDISIQWRVPETFESWHLTTALIVDICTEENVITNNKADVIIRKDGTPIGSTWLANTAYLYGAVVFPSTVNGFSYFCSVAGTSDPVVEPTWPTTVGTTILDPVAGGGATWTCQRQSRTGNFSTVVATWYSEREGNQVIAFTGPDLSIVGVPGDTLNIIVRMYSKASKYVKIGAITLQYTG